MDGNPRTSLCKLIPNAKTNFLMPDSDEHQRRSPDCSFFTLYASINSKPSRSKKSRASKISRLSTQSDLTTTSEVPSVAEKDSTVDETIMSLSEIANPIKPARGAKKATKAKRPVGRAKGKETKAIKEGLQTSNGLLEPEDDTFEVKITSSPRPVANGKKRKSADMNSVHGNESQLEDPESHELTKKRRTTRASSMAEAQEIPLMALDDENELTAHSTDVAEMPPPSVPASKKKPKGSKKRTASSARKVSSASTATKASLRAAVPDDKEIEAALEAELNRTLTDEEGDEELIEARQSEGRRLTRTKAESTKATASVAPTRRGTRANSVAVNGPISDSHPLHVDDSGNAPDLGDEKAPEDRQMKEDIMSSPNVSSQEHGLSQKASTELQHQPGDVGHPEETVVANGNEAWNMRTAKSRTSPQSPECETLASDLAATTMVVREEVDAKDPIPNSQTVQENTQHETDTKQTRNIRGNRKASGTTRKPKQAKKTALTSKYVKGVVRGPMDTQSTGDTDEKSSMVSGFVGNGARVTTEPEPKKTQDQAKADTSPETKSKAGKVAAVREALIISSLEQPDVVMEVQDTPISPPISVMHSTPRPDRSSQSSDVENQPPSSRPSAHRPPLSIQSPSKSQVTRVPLAVTTPTRSPAKGNLSKLQSAFPWTAVDLDCIFQATPSVEKENSPFMLGARAVDAKTELTSPEKKLSVDQWIHLNAARGEEKLRNECERLVGKFEGEGVRALRTLEGILCIG